AMPSLLDPNFSRAVAYICEHTPQGAMGIIINFPLSIHLGDILKNMDIRTDLATINNLAILAGGPIQQERGFVIHKTSSKNWESSLELDDNISITTSKDILKAMAQNKGPKEALVALGYSGWTAGQLEKEIAENSWLISPASLEVMFIVPHEQRWRAAAGLVGVNVDNLSSEVGHA
ncbi:MAG TPA: YqgE/AlgH family protein, partial [Gammaproteobacteria bacterium]|nr:YqgE/AlgH family protein [Gammaproteobacteria bacterium]